MSHFVAARIKNETWQVRIIALHLSKTSSSVGSDRGRQLDSHFRNASEKVPSLTEMEAIGSCAAHRRFLAEMSWTRLIGRDWRKKKLQRGSRPFVGKKKNKKLFLAES